MNVFLQQKQSKHRPKRYHLIFVNSMLIGMNYIVTAATNGIFLVEYRCNVSITLHVLHDKISNFIRIF